jgi:thiol-disulfide isomerase/thioredoxin
MKKNNSFNKVFIAFAVIVVAALGYWYYDKSTPGELDTFAQCLSEKNLKFYGAFWCPHCQAQKALFGKSKDKLPYVECSNPDQKSQTQVCADKKIVSYPTWSHLVASTTASTTDEVFVSGEKTLQQLSEMSGCALPTNTK